MDERHGFSRLIARGRRAGPLDVYFRGLTGSALDHAEHTFFAGLQLSNGTYKTTASGRLDDLNKLVAKLLPRSRPIEIMDVAVSSGVTTLDWTRDLDEAGTEYHLVAGDLLIDGVIATIRRHAAVLWEKGGHPLAVQVGARCIYLTRRHPLTRYLGPLLRGMYRNAEPKADAGNRSWSRWCVFLRVRTLQLVTPRLGGRPRIDIVQDDIGETGRYDGQFDVCRAANILNRSYFSEDTIVELSKNLLARLRDGGLLVVCRTSDVDEINRATILRRRSGTVTVVERLNGGCEIESLLLQAATGPEASRNSW